MRIKIELEAESIEDAREKLQDACFDQELVTTLHHCSYGDRIVMPWGWVEVLEEE